MKSILITGLLFCLAISTIHTAGQERARDENAPQANSTSDQIEVKTDRFSKVTTVTLKPQKILDKLDHVITMEIETKLEVKAPDDMFKDLITARAIFESRSKKPEPVGT